AAHSSRISRSGIWIRMPAPSPASGSAPTAPRWVRLARIFSPSRTVWWLLRFLMSATKPTPQESCSLRGSYRPVRLLVALGDIDNLTGSARTRPDLGDGAGDGERKLLVRNAAGPLR